MTYPHVLSVLRLLAGAGDQGMLTGTMARAYTEPAPLQRRLAQVNTVMASHERRGLVRKEKARAEGRRPVPTHRWFITAAGRDYLAAGGHDGQRARSRAARQVRSEARLKVLAKRRELLEKETALAPEIMASGCMIRRNEAMIRLRAAGVPGETIGRLYGVTRERVRQVAGSKPARRRCSCAACSPGGIS